MTQGGPLSPTISNLMVDAAIGEWLRQVVSGKLARDGITSVDIQRLQRAFDLLAKLLIVLDSGPTSKRPRW